jgi:hypothetical protein
MIAKLLHIALPFEFANEINKLEISISFFVNSFRKGMLQMMHDNSCMNAAHFSFLKKSKARVYHDALRFSLIFTFFKKNRLIMMSAYLNPGKDRVI